MADTGEIQRRQELLRRPFDDDRASGCPPVWLEAQAAQGLHGPARLVCKLLVASGEQRLPPGRARGKRGWRQGRLSRSLVVLVCAEDQDGAKDRAGRRIRQRVPQRWVYFGEVSFIHVHRS